MTDAEPVRPKCPSCGQGMLSDLDAEAMASGLAWVDSIGSFGSTRALQLICTTGRCAGWCDDPENHIWATRPAWWAKVCGLVAAWWRPIARALAYAVMGAWLIVVGYAFATGDLWRDTRTFLNSAIHRHGR